MRRGGGVGRGGGKGGGGGLTLVIIQTQFIVGKSVSNNAMLKK